MPKEFNLVMAQMDFRVGDISGNVEKIVKSCVRAKEEMNADLVVFSELCLAGYPPEDLLLRDDFNQQVQDAVQQCQQEIKDVAFIIGYNKAEGDKLYNAAGLFYQGRCLTEYYKRHLPNYGVFDEKRYFIPGEEQGVIEFKGMKFSLLICEDAWIDGDMVCEDSAAIIIINASPFRVGKAQIRRQQIKKLVVNYNQPVIYTNNIGGQDELVFDGGSFAMNALGEVVVQSGFFISELTSIKLEIENNKIHLVSEQEVPALPKAVDLLYRALVLGLHDYVMNNGFFGVYVGLSGGIDSALTLALAVAALGAEQVFAVAMPSKYSSPNSIVYAKAQAELLGVTFIELPISNIMASFTKVLSIKEQENEVSITEQNIQARIRGVLLMALANENKRLVLTTGNKSELSVGYCTLYGDMVGGFAVLKDVFKHSVYELAKYCNQLANKEIIPQEVLQREPSAELAPGQKDTDSLPEYADLDKFLALYIEEDASVDTLLSHGFKFDMIKEIIHKVKTTEYKRVQAPPGVRVSKKGFGRDRRYPITYKFIN